MTIVCGTDLSAHARPALRAAAALALRLGDRELCLVHTLDPAWTERLSAAQLEQLKADTAQRLVDEFKELDTGFDATLVQPHVLVGAAAESLAALAARKHAALLVVASQGHGASPLYRLGGTSERVAVVSEVPVLVIRDAAPFVAWSRNERPLRIVVGLDFTSNSDAAVALVKTLRQAGPCDVVFAHVYYWYDIAARYGMAPLAKQSLAESDQRTDALLIRDLAQRVGDVGGVGTVAFLPKVGLGRLGDHVLEIAEAEQADLILVGTHRRSLARRLASVSSVVLHYGHASAACVPLKEGGPAEEMRTIRRVLIPTDLSPFANHAIAHGYSLLSERGGEVHLVHVVTPHNAQAPAAEHYAELVRQLRALVPAWAAERGIVTRTDIVHRSDVARGLHVTATRVAADVVCMASHGRSGLQRAVLGSVAEEVMRESTVPVLVVRPST